MYSMMLKKCVLQLYENHVQTVYQCRCILSCSIGSRTLIKFLLEKGLKTDTLSRRQFTALHLAAYRVRFKNHKIQLSLQLQFYSSLDRSPFSPYQPLLVVNFFWYLDNKNSLKCLEHVTYFQYEIFTQLLFTCHHPSILQGPNLSLRIHVWISILMLHNHGIITHYCPTSINH